MEASSIDWEFIHECLPYDDSADSEMRRREMWDLFNVNDEKFLTEYELEKGIVEMSLLDPQDGQEYFDSQRAISESYNFVKGLTKGDVQMEKIFYEEFAVFVKTLRQYFYYYEVFNWIDSEGDHSITKDEFCGDEQLATIEKWVGPLDNPGATFDAIADGRDGLPFKEFMEWALAKNFEHELALKEAANKETEELEEEGDAAQ